MKKVTVIVLAILLLASCSSLTNESLSSSIKSSESITVETIALVEDVFPADSSLNSEPDESSVCSSASSANEGISNDDVLMMQHVDSILRAFAESSEYQNMSQQERYDAYMDLLNQLSTEGDVDDDTYNYPLIQLDSISGYYEEESIYFRYINGCWGSVDLAYYSDELD